MAPGRASASGVHYSDSCAGEGGSCMGDSDPFWGYGTEEGSASVDTLRWGGVSLVQPDTLKSPLSLYSPEHDSSLLSPTSLFKELPSGGAGIAAPSGDIYQQSVDEIGLTSPSGDIHQQSVDEIGLTSPSGDIHQQSVDEIGLTSPSGDIHQQSVDESVPSPELPQKLCRKRSRGAKQTEVLPAPKKSADRTVQIADFTWTLPPDPGKGGPYPSLTFLIGAAISSSDSGAMKLAEIRQWIRARYPSRSASENRSISNALTRQADFIYTPLGGIWSKGLWRLGNPQQFRSYYEEDMFLKQRYAISFRDREPRHPLPASEQENPGAFSPALSVKFEDQIITLPPYSAGQERPPLKLLCGCAMALGPEQGTSAEEITEWIAERYLVQEAHIIKRMKANICSTLSTSSSDFRCVNICAPKRSKKGGTRPRWTLKSPAAFAARCGLSEWGHGSPKMLPSSRVGTVAPSADVHQVPVSERAHSPESPPKLPRERSHGVEPSVVLPSVKKPTPRTVQIAGFTWTLPPDPGSGGPYPVLTFLIGAAISSSDSGMMTVAEISQWIRARYPSRLQTSNSAITNALSKQTDFIHIPSGIWSRGLWRLRSPQQFRGYYEKNIFLKQRYGVGFRDRGLRNPLPAPEQGSTGAVSWSGALPAVQPVSSGTVSEVPIVPALSVEIGGHMLTLPPYRAGQKRPSVRLLCGCAIALGHEQGSSVAEIGKWIASRYSIQGASAIKKLEHNVRSTLNVYNIDFRRTDVRVSRRKKERSGICWVLSNPADFRPWLWESQDS